MGIGKILADLLTQKNMKVSELSERAHVRPSTIYSIIKRDNMKVDLDILLSIARVLGVPAEYFKDGKLASFPSEKATFTQHYENLIQSVPDLTNTIDLYISLDEVDRSEIRGEMKGMLRADKYKSKIKDESAG